MGGYYFSMDSQYGARFILFISQGTLDTTAKWIARSVSDDSVYRERPHPEFNIRIPADRFAHFLFFSTKNRLSSYSHNAVVFSVRMAFTNWLGLYFRRASVDWFIFIVPIALGVLRKYRWRASFFYDILRRGRPARMGVYWYIYVKVLTFIGGYNMRMELTAR